MMGYVTDEARGRLRRLVEGSAGAHAVKFLCLPFGGVVIETVYTLDDREDIIIAAEPTVFTDRFTLLQIEDHALDYDAEHDELVISWNPNHVLTAP